MDAKERARILHGLATIEAVVNDNLQHLRLDRSLGKSTSLDCCIHVLEGIKEDMKYGIKVIEDEARWTSQ